MRIAFPTKGKTINDDLDEVFGRAEGFLIFDTESKNVELIDNSKNIVHEHGVGIKSAELILSYKVDLIVSKTLDKRLRISLMQVE
ncbi:MAG: NifB/NifX family molybdenum-iron cluster-binding protein [Caldisericia bacterium]